MVNMENLEEAIREAKAEGDMETLGLLLELKMKESVGMNSESTDNNKQKQHDTNNVNLKAIANYFKED